MTGTVRLDPRLPVSHARAFLADLDGTVPLLVSTSELDDTIVDLLLAALGPGVATASPVPVGQSEITVYQRHRHSPPAASLPLPCRTACVIAGGLAAQLSQLRPDAATTDELIVAIAERLLQRGWRHIVAPGVALKWDSADSSGIEATAAWQPSTIRDLVGPANACLEAHMSWAASQVDSLRVAIDGACITDDPHTGTQLLVVEVARAMATSRPAAIVVLAVPSESLDAANAAVGESGVRVVDRSSGLDADVLYRPYQMLRTSELEFVRNVGRRRLVGQLDMIGFSNPFYHPSSGLFALARNLQRHLMRTCDGVTFISEYGRATAVAECPDMQPSRLHVVSCGADTRPVDHHRPPRLGAEPPGQFVVCASATFWHKNRAHAIETFSHLCKRGYSGSLIVFGPEPYYGRSVDADARLLETLDPPVASRTEFWGQVSENDKWWLLSNADAVVYPSVVEGFGLVPFEAAAVGTPCLAFAGTAQGELLSGTDATISSWDPQAWAERISSWVNDDDARLAAVDQIRRVGSDRTWERCAELTWDAIDDALAQPRCSQRAEDGGLTSRIGAWWEPEAPMGSIRFTAARVAPALIRRVQSLAHRTRMRK